MFDSLEDKWMGEMAGLCAVWFVGVYAVDSLLVVLGTSGIGLYGRQRAPDPQVPGGRPLTTRRCR